LVIVTPGQDTLLTLRNTLSGGRVAGLSTALGIAGGQLAWTVAATAGVGAALLASPMLFLTIRIAGGVYLVGLGAQSLRSAMGRESAKGELPGATRSGSFIRQGLLSNLGNPKMLVFFTGLLPQFASPEAPGQLILLGVVFCLMTICWLDFYVLAVGKLGRLLGRPQFRQTLEGVTGGVLVALGVTVAADAVTRAIPCGSC
jgi:threonine/homoserine/homoserine lactone efflux protein